MILYLFYRVMIEICIQSIYYDVNRKGEEYLDSCDRLAVYGEKRISGSGQLNTWLDELGFHFGVSKNPESTEEMNDKS